MKREELIDRFRNESAKADIRANYHRSEFAEGQASAYEAAAEFIEESIPANSITLTLPVYADGDPRAGGAIQPGDVVRTWTKCTSGYWLNECSNGSLSVDVENGKIVVRPAHSAYALDPPYFSTPSARDAALAAAKEAHNDR